MMRNSAVLALLAAATMVQAADVSGLVRDRTGSVLVGAQVTLHAQHAPSRVAVTDVTGRFRFDGLVAGKYTLRVEADGFRPIATEMQIAAAGTTEVNLTLEVAAVASSVTVSAAADEVRAQLEESYAENKSVISVAGTLVNQYNPVANYDALRLLPGVMSAGGGRDRFSTPSHIRGAQSWGQIETVDDYPAINITPVSAEDGGYTAGFSSIIPSLALERLTLETGGLGVVAGQASGGVIRSSIKRGNVNRRYSTLRAEGVAIGEGVFLGETAGGFRSFDYYLAAQGAKGSYGDKYETFPRPIQRMHMASGLAKLGWRTQRGGRLETLVIAGDDDHSFFQKSFNAALGRDIRRDFHTEKQNYFLATRYDYRPTDDWVFGAGLTYNKFHENRIEDSADGQSVGVSRRNRPQYATRGFANLSLRRAAGWGRYMATGGAELSRDRFSDITATPLRFSFAEQSVYWRNSFAFSNGVTVNAGIRFSTLDNGFVSERLTLYDVGAAYRLPSRTRLFASYSTGYKLNKAFYLWWGGGQFIRRPGSRGLRPSETDTAEFGAEQSLGGRGLVRVSHFRTDEVNLFNFANTGTATPFNDDASINGTEVWTEWRVGRLRPFASFTHLRNYRTRSTNPAATNIDLRFTPLPNKGAGFGSYLDVSPRLSVALMGYYDDGRVQEAVVNDIIIVSRYARFLKVNAAATYLLNERVQLVGRVENLLNARDMGYDRTELTPDGGSRRVVGTQRDPGITAAVGLQVRF